MEMYSVSSEWPPCTRNYLERGRTPRDVIAAMVEKAVDEDEFTGDGMYLDIFESDEKSLPTCRNDKEYGFVLNMLLRDGIQPEFDPDQVTVIVGLDELEDVPDGTFVQTLQEARLNKPPQRKEDFAKKWEVVLRDKQEAA